MPKTFLLLAMCVMMTLSLQAAGFPNPQDGQQPPASNMASTYVTIESWDYSAFDRLAAEGYLPAAFFSLRPWTRMDCARLVDEAEEQVDETEGQIATKLTASDVPALLASLKEEFAVELARRAGARNAEFRMESLDQRVTTIAGRPLTDGFHFGETLVNDDGRPFAEGANINSGVSFRATAGPFAACVRAELQRVTSAPVPDASPQRQIAAVDFTSTAAAGPVSGFFRGRLLEANVSFTVSNTQFTIGRQSLWRGPARGGTTLFSNKAEPIDMLRYDRVRPLVLPGGFKLLGPIRAQVLIGRLSGTQYVQPSNTLFGTSGVALGDQTFIQGEKFSFKPTPNIEFSVSRTVIFGGTGSPVNSSTFLRSVFSGSTENGANDPGDRREAFESQYRTPGLRNCLTGYFDGLSEDQPFPLAYPTESAWLSSFFLRCVPRLPHLTFRAEGLLSPHRDLTLLFASLQHNAAFTLQLSYRPIGRVRE